MQTIKEEKINELIISKSKFITILIRVDDVSLVKETINQYKTLYPDATHYCYAYIIGNNKRSSDDGEPSGTAGSPMLNVLEREHLTNILCLVIRYFGGTKLGTGGLVRAYTKCVTLAIYESEKIKLVEGVKLVITFNYDHTKVIDYLLKDLIIKESDFKEDVSYTFDISKEQYLIIKGELTNVTNTIYEKENVFIQK